MKPFLRRVTTILGSARSDMKATDGGRLPSRRSGTTTSLALLAGAILVSAVLGAGAASLLFGDETEGGEGAQETGLVAPEEGSAEAGFARDMMVHHAQAVQMSEIVRDKTESQEIRTMAADIALTQQAQIGQMQGWLAVWGLPLTGTGPTMEWMGHPKEGRMPGMASPEELGELQGAEPEEADVLFLELMIPHHEAAVPMAEAVLEETEREEVERLAGAIMASQQGEIQLMQGLLNQRGITPEVLSAPIEGHFVGEEPHEGSHPEHQAEPHPEQETSAVTQETATGIVRGAAQGAAAFLVGLASFVALVWLPTSRTVGAGRDATGFFVPCVWVMFGLLLVASVAEISSYAVRASGEPFGLGLLGQAVFDTRVGHVWLVRIVSGFLVAVAATIAARLQRPAYWWWAVGTGAALLETLTLTSHAAAEGILASLADWLHLAAVSVWMGGLLGLALFLLGPLRAMPKKQRTKLCWRAVRRFSRLAILAVMTILVTGLYATLLHVPDVEKLMGTPYGSALMIKLGLAVLLLVAGGINLALDGRRPFGRMVVVELVLAVGIFAATGFLTSLPPADAVSP